MHMHTFNTPKMHVFISSILTMTRSPLIYSMLQVLKHKIDNIKRMAAHPTLPLCKLYIFKLSIVFFIHCTIQLTLDDYSLYLLY